MSNQDSFYQNFQGFKHCSIFHFQGSCCCCSQRQRLISYHIVFALSTTFLNFFLNLFRFALPFSTACYILPDVHVLVNSFFIFLFNPRCFSRVSYIIPFNHWFVNRFFQFFVLFFNKRGSRMKSIHPVPSSAAFSYKKPFNMRRNSQLNKLF